MTAPRDALSQLEAVLALIPERSASFVEEDFTTHEDGATWTKEHGQYLAAAANLIRDHAETLRALLGAADGVEVSPEFTDTGRAALLSVLWRHQGASSAVGQPIRFALGMGQHDRLSDWQVAEAKRWDAMTTLTKAPAND